MNFLLDRFPIDTYLELKSALLDEGHEVPFSTLTHLSTVNDNFSGDFYFDRDIACGIVTKNVPWVISRSDIIEASKFEGIVLGVIARYDIGQKNYSAQEMSSHFYELYNFWIHIINHYKIDFCLQHYIPHEPSSFILYVVLKNKKIPCIFTDVPHIFNKYKFLSCSFQERNLLLLNYDETQNFDFENESKIYNYNINQNNTDSIPKTTRFRNEKNIILKNICKYYNLFRNDIHTFIKKVKVRLFKNPYGNSRHFFIKSRHSWSSSKNQITRIGIYFFSKTLHVKLFLNRLKYQFLCISIPKGKFVYFAMSAQPEATTLPSALEFRDVFMTLRILREVIPQEIPILIKENPSVFETRNIYLSGVGYRCNDFYQQILNIPNTFFVSIFENSHSLIRHSILTATMNGTAAIEAVHLGRPAITFGSNWYDGIDFIQKYNNIEELKLFVDQYAFGMSEIDCSSTSIKLDRNVMIEFDKHVPYEFEKKDRIQLINAFIVSINKFHKLDSRKWSF